MPLLNVVTNNLSPQIPVHTIACSLGFEGSVAVEKILKQDNRDLGYDLATGMFLK